MSSLKISHIKKYFGGVKAIDDILISFDQGKITGIIGPNGSGKTTLMNCISGFLPFDHGAISVSGQSFTTIKPWDIPDMGITRTFQNVRVFEQISVLDNLLVVMTKRNPFLALADKHTDMHIHEANLLLEKLGLTHQKNNLASNLSYGQRKLLEIGRALAMKSDTYLFDEPYAGLFPEMVKKVSTIMQELRNQGKTVILIEHNMSLIRQLCDHVIVMDAGKLLAQGIPDIVLSNKQVIEAYLGE
jgi:neutral amino acid transport system ATP-binding protein